MQVAGFVEFRHLGNVGGPAELCVVQRVVSLDMTPAVRRLRRPGTKLVYDVDDNLFAVDQRNSDAFALYNRPETLDGLRTAARLCDLITVTTPELATVMEHECGVPTAVLPNCISDPMFDVERQRWDRVRIGWAGGAGHDTDMATIVTPMRRFLDRHPEVDLHFIGHDYRRMMKRERVYYSTWQQPIERYWAALDFDIGIAPLARNTFNQSKSGLKCAEYSALGIPCVATDAPPYRNVIIDGVTGFLITRPDQWVSRLAELTADPELRERMGAAAREHVRANFSMGRHWRNWEVAYAGLLGIREDAAADPGVLTV